MEPPQQIKPFKSMQFFQNRIDIFLSFLHTPMNLIFPSAEYISSIFIHAIMVDPKHLIISRTDGIGDVVLTLPLSGYLKHTFPSTRISFLGRTYTEPIVTLSKNIDHFINWDLVSKKDPRSQLAEFKRLQADWIIHVFPNGKIAWLAQKAGIKNRAGTSHRIYHWWTCNKLTHFSRKRSEVHEAQLNFRLLSPLGIDKIPSIENIPTFYGLTKLPQPSHEMISLIDPHRFNLILHPKTRGSAREWGLSNFEKLIDLLPEKMYKIFVTGTEDEGHAIKTFLQKNSSRITNLAGRLSLNDLVIFISLVDGLVAASTGPLHIAAALGKKAIGLYAPMRPIHPGRWAPLGKAAKALVLDKDCKLCRSTNICTCIEAISPVQVVAALESSAVV
ncbi:MAG: lipopolysaccharide heptosyltransferase family protein [Desulfobacteraceae bacterium]|nr:MAG: lipopolysaccharide heptosyltransferase family protein [Desulfobacteraceae bacterium]